MSSGIVSEPVPVEALAENFSSIPRIAPPPFGREICGAENGEAFSGGPLVVAFSSTTRSRRRHRLGITHDFPAHPENFSLPGAISMIVPHYADLVE